MEKIDYKKLRKLDKKFVPNKWHIWHDISFYNPMKRERIFQFQFGIYKLLRGTLEGEEIFNVPHKGFFYELTSKVI